MTSIPLKSMKGKERDVQPFASTSSATPASAVPLISAPKTEIDELTFIRRRAEDMIRERWKSDTDGQIVFFRAAEIERYLDDEDINAWAFELASHSSTLDQPSHRLLSQWTCEPLSSRYHVIPEHAHQSLTLARKDSISTLSSASSASSAESGYLDGLGYHVGSGVKGIGNIIIRGITTVDTRYRTAKLLTWLRVMDYLWWKARKRAFHRSILGLVTPRKQVNGLLDEIWDYQQSGGLFFPYNLASILDTKHVPLSPYLSMKWLRLAQFDLSPLSLAAVDSALFLDDCQSEEDVLAHTRRLVLENYAGELDMSVVCKEDAQARFYAQVFLSWISADNSFPTWYSTWGFASFVEAPLLIGSTRSEQISELLECLSRIVSWDPDTTLDAPPSSQYSIWEETCRLLRCISSTVTCLQSTES